MSKSKNKVYVVRDTYDTSNCFYTDNKETLKAFLNFREPGRYEWVKIKKEKDVERTHRLFNDSTLHRYKDIALSEPELEALHDHLMSLPPCIMNDIEKLVDILKYIKVEEDEEKEIVEMLKIVHDLLYSIEELPIQIDELIDETYIFDEYLLAKKFLIEQCL